MSRDTAGRLALHLDRRLGKTRLEGAVGILARRQVAVLAPGLVPDHVGRVA